MPRTIRLHRTETDRLIAQSKQAVAALANTVPIPSVLFISPFSSLCMTDDTSPDWTMPKSSRLKPSPMRNGVRPGAGAEYSDEAVDSLRPGQHIATILASAFATVPPPLKPPAITELLEEPRAVSSSSSSLTPENPPPRTLTPFVSLSAEAQKRTGASHMLPAAKRQALEPKQASPPAVNLLSIPPPLKPCEQRTSPAPPEAPLVAGTDAVVAPPPDARTDAAVAPQPAELPLGIRPRMLQPDGSILCSVQFCRASMSVPVRLAVKSIRANMIHVLFTSADPLGLCTCVPRTLFEGEFPYTSADNGWAHKLKKDEMRVAYNSPELLRVIQFKLVSDSPARNGLQALVPRTVFDYVLKK
jgi:hypothetical protein